MFYFVKDFVYYNYVEKVGEFSMITQEEIERDYVDTLSAARELGITDARIRKLCSEGRFEGALKTGRAWIIPKISVKNFIRLRPRSIKRELTDREVIGQAIKESNRWKEIIA